MGFFRGRLVTERTDVLNGINNQYYGVRSHDCTAKFGAIATRNNY
jgi:hypothetical protein